MVLPACLPACLSVCQAVHLTHPIPTRQRCCPPTASLTQTPTGHDRLLVVLISVDCFLDLSSSSPLSSFPAPAPCAGQPPLDVRRGGSRLRNESGGLQNAALFTRLFVWEGAPEELDRFSGGSRPSPGVLACRSVPSKPCWLAPPAAAPPRLVLRAAWGLVGNPCCGWLGGSLSWLLPLPALHCEAVASLA